MNKKLAPQPGVNLNNVDFKIKPYIARLGDDYYLCYQLARTTPAPLVHVLYARKSADRAYYFFSVPISHEDPGRMVKRDVSLDGFTSFAEHNSIYWLNENGTEIQLPIREERAMVSVDPWVVTDQDHY